MASLDRDAPSTAGALYGLVYFSTWFMGAAVVCVGALTIAPVLFSQPWIAGTSAFSGTIVGALVLAFRLIVLIVIVRVAIRGYEWARATHFQRRPLMPPVAWVTAPRRDGDFAGDDPVLRAARKALRARRWAGGSTASSRA